MARKPTYEELEQRVRELEKETLQCMQIDRALENELRKFRILYELAIAMTAEHSLDENLRLVVETSKELLHADTSYIALRDAARRDVFMHSLSGIRTEAFKKMRLPFGKGLGGLVAKTRKGYIVEDYFAEKSIDRVVDRIVADEGVISGMAVPIQMGAENLGVLYIFNRRRTAFSQSDLDTLFLMGNLAAMEIARKRADEGRRNARDELERRVEERTAELFKSNEHLKLQIEERRRATEKLRKSEERYRLLAENVTDVIWIRDMNLRFTYISPSVTEMTGFSVEEAMASTPEDTYTPASVEIAKKALAEDLAIERMEQKDPFRTRTLEMEGFCKDGTTIWTEAKMTFLRDPDGQPIGILGVSRDISERKQAEKALRGSEEKYRTILEGIEEGYFEVDLAGNFIFFNDSMCRMAGFSCSEITGKNNRDFATPETAKKMYRAFNEVYRTGKPARMFDCEILRKDGSTCIFELSASLMRHSEGKAIGFRGIVRDVTERILADDELDRERKRFRVLVEKTPLGVSIIGEDGHYKYVNPKFVEIFGYTLEDIPTGREWFRKACPDRKYRMQVISTWINDQKESKLEEPRPRTFTVKCKDGLEKLIHFRPVTMETGEQFVIYENITERKRLEAQLLHAQKMESLGAIASGMAHNFRNILSEISINSQLLQMKYQSKPPLIATLERINSAVKKGAQLIDGLMQFSRKGGVKNLEILNLAQVIQEAFDIVSKSFDKKVNFQIEHPEILPVMGDHLGLSQVIMNLCINARDAMPDGGELHIEAGQKEGRAEIIISDTGVGMGKETLEKCFDPFFTTKEVGKGTGLGLSTSYGIIREHNGEIHVSSEIGKGTTFKIVLPISSPEKGDREGIISDVICGRGQKILIVDDEIDLLQPMEELLESIGYEAVSVSSGEAAISRHASWQPDALLIDRNMPEMDGITCAKKIAEKDSTVKIVLISGYEEKGPNGIDPKIKDLISGYLTKPLGINGLSKTLARLFEK